jgi:hypothetical protein
VYIERNSKAPPVAIAAPAESPPASVGPNTPIGAVPAHGENTEGTSRPAAVRPTEQLARERALLDVARGALEREDPSSALDVTDRHAHVYPTGFLAQEREAMAVRALVMLGRTEEARARVGRFRTAYPDSILLPSLASAVGEMPSSKNGKP